MPAHRKDSFYAFGLSPIESRSDFGMPETLLYPVFFLSPFFFQPMRPSHLHSQALTTRLLTVFIFCPLFSPTYDLPLYLAFFTAD